MDVHESEALFRLLDDGDGCVTLDEFINGILRCKGAARAIDQLALHAEVRCWPQRSFEDLCKPIGCIAIRSLYNTYNIT